MAPLRAGIPGALTVWLGLVGSVVGLGGSGAGCRPRPSTDKETRPMQSDFDESRLAGVRAERQQFRARQDASLRSELSPLGRVGFLHAADGVQVLRRGTSDTDLTLATPAEAAAPGSTELARFAVEHARGFFQVQGATELRLDGGAADARPLRERDVLARGNLRLLVVGLPADPSLAIYDLRAPERLAYQGLHYFPDDDRYVVRGRLRRFESPRPVRVQASRGEPKDMHALGTLEFTVAGTACSMVAYAEGDGDDRRHLFLVFRDQTSGKPGGSYGAGRFLSTVVGAGDEVVLDFNQAWNPLCAYSVYFHCPLPPRENWLPVALPVGERVYSEH